MFGENGYWYVGHTVRNNRIQRAQAALFYDQEYDCSNDASLCAVVGRHTVTGNVMVDTSGSYRWVNATFPQNPLVEPNNVSGNSP